MTVADDTLLRMNAYHDGELSPLEALELEDRLAADPELRATADRLQRLSAALGTTFGAVAVPRSLEARVRNSLAPRPAAARFRPPAGSWPAIAATLVLGVTLGALAGGGGMYLAGPTGAESVAEAVLAGHLRGLAAVQPFDVASSDRHVVKPWFNGRTVVAPDAPDLADKGFPLIGGRVDIVDGRPVPTLVYRHDRHVISVTAVPATRPTALSLRHGGSNLRAWTTGDLTYWAASDLNGADLGTFVELFRARTAAPG